MFTHKLHVLLLSDATFGRGDGVAGLVDEEITHDPRTGLPFIRGRVLKGLLVEACANLLYVLPPDELLAQAARYLFGQPGSGLADDAHMRVGAARLPEALIQAVQFAIDHDSWNVPDVLQSLTTIRRQTAVDEERGAPERGSLRSMRVLLRDITLTATLSFASDPATQAGALPLLAACAAELRRGGTGRNRGRGRLQVTLEDEVTMQEYLKQFAQCIGAEAV